MTRRARRRRSTAAGDATTTIAAFAVRLDNFEGPFDLLLQPDLQAQAGHHRGGAVQGHRRVHRHIKAGGEHWDLEQTTSFLLVAATLLDLKAARLLPQGDVEDEEDLALLEARDLLFARLLQYRAFKQVAARPRPTGWPTRPGGTRARSGSRSGSPTLLPDVLIGLGLEEFAALAAQAMEPKPEPELVAGAHPRARRSACASRRRVVVARLRASGTMTFRALAGRLPGHADQVARFLALLELFREGVVAFDQVTPLGELTIRWTGGEDGEIEITDEFDGAPPEASPDADAT